MGFVTKIILSHLWVFWFFFSKKKSHQRLFYHPKHFISKLFKTSCSSQNKKKSKKKSSQLSFMSLQSLLLLLTLITLFNLRTERPSCRRPHVWQRMPWRPHCSTVLIHSTCHGCGLLGIWCHTGGSLLRVLPEITCNITSVTTVTRVRKEIRF